MQNFKNKNNGTKEPPVLEETASGENPCRKGRIKRFFKRAASIFVMAVVISVTGLYAIPTFAAQRTVVDGPSMEANYYDGENVIVNKLSYRFEEPERFDVITIYPYGRKYDNSFKDFISRYADRYIYNKEKKEEYYIKRIIGLPGETIQITEKDIYINGKVLEEDYGKTEITFPGVAADPVVLGRNEYFVLGDNREISKDSRTFGAVSKENIGGKVIKLFN